VREPCLSVTNMRLNIFKKTHTNLRTAYRKQFYPKPMVPMDHHICPHKHNISYFSINIISSVIELLISSPRYRNSETYRMSLSPILSNGKVLAINPSRYLGWKKHIKKFCLLCSSCQYKH